MTLAGFHGLGDGAKMAAPLKTSFEGWRYTHYFEFVARKYDNVTVKCKLCPGQKQLSTAVNTTSNISKHLQRQHANIKLVAKDPVTLKISPHQPSSQGLIFNKRYRQKQR